MNFVDKACMDWLTDTKNLDKNGRIIKPGLAKIRSMARDFQDDHLRKVQARIEFKEPQSAEKRFCQAVKNHSRMFGGMPGSRHTAEDAKEWEAERQEWFDSPDFPFPPEKCRYREDPSISVAQYWQKIGR